MTYDPLERLLASTCCDIHESLQLHLYAPTFKKYSSSVQTVARRLVGRDKCLFRLSIKGEFLQCPLFHPVLLQHRFIYCIYLEISWDIASITVCPYFPGHAMSFHIVIHMGIDNG
jgi:hypothetical protein